MIMGTAKKSNYNDLRVRKTERAIRSALLQLVKEKEVNRITVRELAEQAEINKTTFYAHYETIQDLIETLEQESVDYIVANLNNFHMLFDNPDRFIDDLYQTLYDAHIDSITHTNSGNGHFSELLNDALLEKTAELDINLDQYHQIGALLGFILDGLLGFVSNRTDTRFSDLEYIKDFIRGGIHEIDKTKLAQ